MSNTKLYIPQKLNVGYQEREDTYTGKLAYVVYTDDKGVIRKETSWKVWCKEFIGEVENIPLEGFVLNKGVGGQRQSWGWNARNEYIRVYDPRGWEFEISVANLLYILQECTSTKGKGLEGSFVYSWEGKELVLLPTDTYEYKQSTQFTNNQSKKVTKTEMVKGKMYQFKSGDWCVYLGRHNCTENFFTSNKDWYNTDFSKKHIFYNIETNKYLYEKGFTKLANIGEKCATYTEHLEAFIKSWRYNKVVDFRWEKDTYPQDGWYHYYFVKTDNGVIKCNERYHYSDEKLNTAYCKHYKSVGDFESSYYTYTNVNKDFGVDKEIVKPIFILENGEEIEDVR